MEEWRSQVPPPDLPFISLAFLRDSVRTTGPESR